MRCERATQIETVPETGGQRPLRAETPEHENSQKASAFLKRHWKPLIGIAWITVCVVGCSTQEDAQQNGSGTAEHNHSENDARSPAPKKFTGTHPINADQRLVGAI